VGWLPQRSDNLRSPGWASTVERQAGMPVSCRSPGKPQGCINTMTANNGWICVEANRYGPKLRVCVTDKVCVFQNHEQFGSF